jgi:CheY-like chemotaxis protein
LLAGRKLLLADDSITIQKVVDLTFADEGVSVVCVSNGRDAVERLEEFAPDIVLADVFMPQMNGYEVCEYIKLNDKLKHIPVMLLVGSFEPFDEEEARRVGANDILTKPFQSIRRLIDKVGLLISNRPPEERIPTAELPKPEAQEPQVEKLSTAELESSTADTQPLPAELRHVIEEAASPQAKQEGTEFSTRSKVDYGTTENNGMESRSEVVEQYEGAGEVLLDLGEFDSAPSSPDEDFVLDIDLDEIPETSPVEPVFPTSAFRSRDKYDEISGPHQDSKNVAWPDSTTSSEAPSATIGRLATTPEFERVYDEVVEAPQLQDETGRGVEQYSTQPSVQSAPSSAQELSPEMIDAIARRVVEQLSEKVVQEIAWEVVPQLAELLIKRQLEEKSS